jgi:hypothetical protein
MNQLSQLSNRLDSASCCILGKDIMKIPRRTSLHLAAGAAILPSMSRLVWAQSYPARPVRIVVGWGHDRHRRACDRPNGCRSALISNSLSRTGRVPAPMWRPKRSRAPADGYTLLMATGSNAINATLFERLNYNFLRDIVPVVGVDSAPWTPECYADIALKRPARARQTVPHARVPPTNGRFGARRPLAGRTWRVR